MAAVDASAHAGDGTGGDGGHRRSHSAMAAESTRERGSKSSSARPTADASESRVRRGSGRSKRSRPTSSSRVDADGGAGVGSGDGAGDDAPKLRRSMSAVTTSRARKLRRSSTVEGSSRSRRRRNTLRIDPQPKSRDTVAPVRPMTGASARSGTLGGARRAQANLERERKRARMAQQEAEAEEAELAADLLVGGACTTLTPAVARFLQERPLMYLSGCWVYLAGFDGDNERERRLTALIRRGGGSRLTKFGALVTHVVAREDMGRTCVPRVVRLAWFVGRRGWCTALCRCSRGCHCPVARHPQCRQRVHVRRCHRCDARVAGGVHA